MSKVTHTSGDLAQRCHDVLEWHRTGLLPDGALRQAAAALPYPDEGQRLGVAEYVTAEEAMRAVPVLIEALRGLLSDVLEYERVNNLAPNPGKQDCWESVTRARAAIAKADGP